MVVKGPETDTQWKMTGFYGNQDTAKRKVSWELLNHLKFFSQAPWFCVGDFNEITAQFEKEGAALRRERQMEVFKETLEKCNLNDLGYMGSRCMWNNKRHDKGFTKEHLDRAVANRSWCELFPSVSVYVLAAHSSDHKPLLVNLLQGTGERHAL